MQKHIDGHFTHTHTHTHTCSVSHFLDFSLNGLFCCCPSPSLSISLCVLHCLPDIHMCVLSSHTHTHTHALTQRMSSVLTPPYVGLGVVADAKTRGTSQYQQSTACLQPLTHHHLTALIINHTRTNYSLIKYRLN